MLTSTTVECWITRRGQMSPLTLVIPDRSERVADVLAEAVSSAEGWWRYPARAAWEVMNYLQDVYDGEACEMYVGMKRSEDSEVVIIEFGPQLAYTPNQTLGTFKRWTRRVLR